MHPVFATLHPAQCISVWRQLAELCTHEYECNVFLTSSYIHESFAELCMHDCECNVFLTSSHVHESFEDIISLYPKRYIEWLFDLFTILPVGKPLSVDHQERE